MPTVQASLEYLQDLALYETEKPYWAFLPPHEGFDPDEQRVDNLEFEEHEGIEIQDIRQLNEKALLNDCGFEVLSHQSKFSGFKSASDVEGYRPETEALLQHFMGAVYVKCYDSRLRRNITFNALNWI